ncbi:MAG: hypothetical protein JO247_06425, partial [Chloroflexi bacterium]|nr:hypothetical protein [Chloroflexota bacterium]
VGPIVASISLLVWLLNPRARKPWLKWLIIVTTPFGLAAYVIYLWALSTPAIVLENAGPVSGLRRSAQLVRGNWFRVSGIVVLLGIVVGILRGIPQLVVSLPLGIARIGALVQNPGGAPQTDPILTVASSAAGSLGLALFGALPAIALTLLHSDARNRLEGADLLERIETLPPPADPVGRNDWTSPALG